MKLSVDLNADLGEGSGHDAELFELISSANIATASVLAVLSAARRLGVNAHDLELRR